MPETPVTSSTPSPLPIDVSDVLVGEVNTTFKPLKPEDIEPEAEQQTTDDDAAPTTDIGAPPPLEPARASSDEKKMFGCLHDILLVLISIILGALLALMLLLGLNGSLFLNDREKTAALEVKIATLEETQDALTRQQEAQKNAIATAEARWQDVDARGRSLESSVQLLEDEQQHLSDQMSALQAQTNEISKTAESVRQDVAMVQDRMTGLDETVATMQGDIEHVKKTAARFDRFVQGLIALISDVAPEELRATEAASTPIASPTPVTKPVITVTPAPTEEPTTLQLFPSQQPIPTPARGSGIIYGLAWLDANNDGVPEADETALSGVHVLLRDERGSPLLSMSTGTDGRFVFINIPPGDYQLLAQPAAEHPLIVPGPQSVTVLPDKQVEINIALTRP